MKPFIQLFRDEMLKFQALGDCPSDEDKINLIHSLIAISNESESVKEVDIDLIEDAIWSCIWLFGLICNIETDLDQRINKAREIMYLIDKYIAEGLI